MKVRYRATPDAPWLTLHGPGDLNGRHGGELLMVGEPEFQYEAGAWCIALSTFVIRRGGSVRRLP